METPALDVTEIVDRIRAQVSASRRLRLSKPGGAEAYLDPRLFDVVEQIFRRALEERDRSLLLLPELLSEQKEFTPDPALRISSHRPVLGPLIVFVKRRVLLPLNRWLFEYTARNFERQEQLNLVLLACVEELAIEVARLRNSRRPE